MLESTFINARKNYDVAVIGAGVFGTWTAYELHKAGKKVVVLDGYGAANNRASSGGESRVIRCSYGIDEIYTRWARRSLSKWQEFFSQVGGLPLFHQTGVLWMARHEDPLSVASLETLERVGVRHEKLARTELENRYPQINFGDISWGIYEPDSGAIMARRAVQTLLQEAIKQGVEYLPEAVAVTSLKFSSNLTHLITSSGQLVSADKFVFACGAWLPKIFPDILQQRIQPTKQEIFFFGTPSGDNRFAPPAMPVWGDFGEEVYGLPDLENRGFKLAIDRHGELFDPDTGSRDVTKDNLSSARDYLANRFPALKDAPLVETRVCQYENTSNGDFLIDRHPDIENVWLVGGGSGHGFKHGPALGEYVAARVTGEKRDIEKRFTLATKDNVQKRTVY
jgi:monomeric sarcosine oxidase